MDAFIGEANFVRVPGGSIQYIGAVYYEGPADVFNVESRVVVPVLATDTGATFTTRMLAAIDTEATRLGLAAPTRCFGSALQKFR